MSTNRNWYKFFDSLSEEEKDNIALLRVMECTNGIIQYAHRDGASYKLSIEETREAMRFSMGSIKRMTIPLLSGDVTFETETEKVLREIRELYINGIKRGNNESYEEFMEVSLISAQVMGMERIQRAAKTIREEVDCEPLCRNVKWGVEYLAQFL